MRSFPVELAEQLTDRQCPRQHETSICTALLITIQTPTPAFVMKLRNMNRLQSLPIMSRGFSPGYELDDWLEAEQELETTLEAFEP